MKIQIPVFSGLLPRTNRRALPDAAAQVANNVSLLRGSIRPFRETRDEETLPDSDRQSLYRYNGRWLSWPTDVDVAKGAVNDQRERIYYTGDGAPKVRMVVVRENSKAYTVGQSVRWVTGDTVWLCTSAGTTDSSAPDIDGIAVGAEVSDGSVTWKKTSDELSGADEVEYDLGVPAPENAPTVDAEAQSSTSWTRTWKYQYEDSSGTILSFGELEEGTDVIEVVPGEQYTVDSKPAGTGTFVLYFDGYSSGGSYLGRQYPSISAYSANSDFFLSGAKGSAVQTNAATVPEATFDLTFDTSRDSGYEVTRNYVYTFVTDAGEEGPPSDVSAAVDVSPTQDAVVSDMDTTFAGNQNVTKKRIYRTVTGTSGTATYQFVDEIPLSQASYTDQKTDADTGEALPSEAWTAPPEDLKGIVSLPGGYLAGFSGNSVWFTEPRFPHAWPIDYEIPVDHKIVGIAVNSAGLIVMTVANPYIMVGSDPESTTSEKIDSNQSCVSKRSIANVDDLTGSVVYASPDGLVLVTGSAPSLITKAHYTREQWQEKNPSDLFSIVHDQRYFGFFNGETIVIDFDEGMSALTTIDQSATGGFSELETDALYLIDGDKVKQWEGGSNRLTALWESKEFFIPVPTHWVCARVPAESYDGTTKMLIYGDGALLKTITIRDSRVFKLPKMPRKKAWSVSIQTDVEVFEFLISTSVRDR